MAISLQEMENLDVSTILSEMQKCSLDYQAKGNLKQCTTKLLCPSV